MSWFPTLCCLLALGATEPAPHQAHPFGPDGQALEGVVDTVSVQVAIPSEAHRTGPATIQLDWRATALALPDRSTLTLRWNGVPLATTTLEQVTRDGTPVPWRVPLPAHTSGYGELTVSSHLALGTPPCETPPDGAWLAVEPTSAVTWRSDGTEELPTVQTLRDWFAVDADPVAIAVDPSAPDGVLAAIALDHHLRDLGSATRPRGGRTVHLEVGPLPDEAPAAAASMARVRANGDLALWADSSAQLLAVVGAMGDGLDERCALPTCWIPRQALGERTEASAPRRDPVQVATVADAGHARGWTTRGAGRRHLRIVWERPPFTDVEAGGPKVRLDIDHVDTARLDGDRSQLHATLNGRPLGTWSLTDPGTLEAPVPDDLLDDDVWVLDIDASLWPVQDERCRWLNPDGLWMVLSATSGMHVPRREAPTGLAAVADARPDAISWSEPLDARERWALAAVSHSLPRPLGGWVSVDRDLCISRRCLVVGSGAGLVDEAGRWTDATGTLAQPMVAATGAVLQASGDDIVLDVGAPLAGVQPPPWARLHGPVALHDGTAWIGLGDADPTHTRNVAASVEAPGRPSDEAAATRAMDLVFGLLFLLTLAGAAGWIWSGVRRGQPVEEL